MKPRVFILTHCRSEETLASATLVFKTLRVGFPSADVTALINAECGVRSAEVARKIGAAAAAAKCQPVDYAKNAGSDGPFIEFMVKTEQRPFWVCHPDVVFFDEVEHWFNERDGIAFAGRLEPEFWCEWTCSLHSERIHPGLMYINPVRLRERMRMWPGQHAFFNSVGYEWFKWHWVKQRGELLRFNDVCAGLWQAVGEYHGTVFDEQQNAAFEHLHCGSYIDLIAPAMGPEWRTAPEAHAAICKQPELARGLREKQMVWYNEHRTKPE